VRCDRYRSCPPRAGAGRAQRVQRGCHGAPPAAAGSAMASAFAKLQGLKK